MAGRGASTAAREIPDDLRALPLSNPPAEEPKESLDLADIRNTLKSLMWRSAGVQRNGESLEEARESITGWCQYVLPRQFTQPEGWELQNMILVSRLIVEAALARTESRGVHLRADFPETNEPDWRRHLTFVHAEVQG